jgi:hypothetical protein
LLSWPTYNNASTVWEGPAPGENIPTGQNDR